MLKRLAILSLSVLAVAPTATAQRKHRIAIVDFGYASVRTAVAAYFGTDTDIGKGICDQLINQLVNDGTFTLIDRTAIDKVMKEQNFSNSDRTDPSTAAKIGGILGVDAIVIGDITTFGSDDKHYGAGALGASTSRIMGGQLGFNRSKQVVEITARVIDVNTGEILASVQGKGEAKRSGLGGGGGAAGSAHAGIGGADMGSSNFQETIIGQAVKASVVQLATNLEAKSGSLPVVAGPTAPPPAPKAMLEDEGDGKHFILTLPGQKDAHEVLAAAGLKNAYIEQSTGDKYILRADGTVTRIPGAGVPTPK